MRIAVVTLVLTVLFALATSANACAIFVLVRDGRILMGNNEDAIDPGVMWFVPASKKNYGRVNFGFDDGFADGSLNEKGLCFDSAALAEVPWEADPNKQTPKNLIERIMNECATVEEALTYFQKYNCQHLAKAQFLFADATGAATVVAWLPESGLSIVRRTGDYLIATNTRLEASGYRCPRHTRIEQVITVRGASLETVASALDAVHQHGPSAFTTYSTVYDLKAGKIFVYNLADFRHPTEFDLAAELAKGRHTHRLAELFPDGPTIRDQSTRAQRTEYGTEVTLENSVLARYEGVYKPVDGPDVAIRIERDGTRLKVKAGEQPEAELFPEFDTVFRIAPDRGQVTFKLGTDGKVRELVLHKGRDLRAARVGPL